MLNMMFYRALVDVVDKTWPNGTTGLDYNSIKALNVAFSLSNLYPPK